MTAGYSISMRSLVHGLVKVLIGRSGSHRHCFIAPARVKLPMNWRMSEARAAGLIRNRG